jgi:hypothetical protein
VIWKDNIIPTNQANPTLLANKAVANKKNARDRNVNVNSANARNKVAAENVVAANKAGDKAGYLGKEAAGGCLPPLLYRGIYRNAYVGITDMKVARWARNLPQIRVFMMGL